MALPFLVMFNLENLLTKFIDNFKLLIMLLDEEDFLHIIFYLLLHLMMLSIIITFAYVLMVSLLIMPLSIKQD